MEVVEISTNANFQHSHVVLVQIVSTQLVAIDVLVHQQAVEMPMVKVALQIKHVKNVYMMPIVTRTKLALSLDA